MERKNNYALQAQDARRLFLSYDQQQLIQKFSFDHDENYLYPRMLGTLYRIHRTSGDLQMQKDGHWCDANSFERTLTLLDLLCDSAPDRHVAGRMQAMQNFGQLFHSKLLEQSADPLAERFDREPDTMRALCEALGAIAVSGADLSYDFPFFEDLRIGLRFWHSDEDFPAQIRWFWDVNANAYLRYETMYYAINLLRQELNGDDQIGSL